MTGVEIKKIYDAARSIFFETVEMLRTLEGEMKGFEQKIEQTNDYLRYR